MNINSPLNYVPEFCNSTIDKISLLLSEHNEKFSEIKELISVVDKNNLLRYDKIFEKMSELEKLYHEIDKEIFRAKEIYEVVRKQTTINIDFSANLNSIEKRMKIVFGVMFIIFSGFVSLSFIFIKIWFGGV